MNQRAVLICCLIVLTLSGTQGMPLSRNARCTCISISEQRVHPRSLEKLEMIPASHSCPHIEIIAVMKKNGEKRCLDPESKFIKHILTVISKKRSKRSPRTRREA